MARQKQFLTTTQAARLLSVSPDTVLKWVKAGKIRSQRTLGGHCRIPFDVLEKFAANIPAESSDVNAALYKSGFRFCWEYLAGSGDIKEECHNCITYRSRSRRCYELRDLPDGLGCLRLGCQTSCDECSYYHLVIEQELNVLILSENENIIKNGSNMGDDDNIHSRFVSSEYECSLLIESFRPDYIVVDCAIGRKRTDRICRDLFDDARLPVTRIILASRSKQQLNYCDSEVFGWIQKPFTIARLRDYIEDVV